MKEINIQQGSLNPFKRAGASFFHIGDGKHILIGGANRSEEFNDIWELQTSVNHNNKQNIYEGQWRKIEIPLSSYTPRSCQTSCQTQNAIYVFGGQNYHENKHYDELLAFDYIANTFSQVGKQSINNPSARNSSTMTYYPKQEKIFLLGGADQQEPLNDLYAFDIATKTWSKQITSGNFPQGIEMHQTFLYTSKDGLIKIEQQEKVSKNAQIVNVDIGLTGNKQQTQQKQAVLHTVNIEFDETNAIREDDDQELQEEEQQIQIQNEEHKDEETQIDYLIVIGGRNGPIMLDSIYSLNLQNYEWKLLQTLPFPICAHSGYLLDNQIYMYGGTDGQTFFENLYYFDLDSQRFYEVQWTQQEKQKYQLKQRMACSMSYDPTFKALLVFGGSGFDDECSQILTIELDSLKNEKRFQKCEKQGELQVKK